MKHFIIENGKERQVVQSLDGYGPEWATVGEADRAPGDYEDWDPVAKKWKVNPERKTKREKQAKARDPEYLLGLIEELQARVAKLEGKT